MMLKLKAWFSQVTMRFNVAREHSCRNALCARHVDLLLGLEEPHWSVSSEGIWGTSKILAEHQL